jgi:archaellum component FlaF (FlaF/FlaG flagellin family)
MIVSGLLGGDNRKALATPVILARVSLSSSGAQGSQWSSVPSVSGDGRMVAFVSAAPDLIPGDTNGAYDIFVRDLVSQTTTRVSVADAGVQGTGGSQTPVISANGRYVAFNSYASNLVPNDTNNANDVFVHDLVMHTTRRVSVDSSGSQMSLGAGGTYFGSLNFRPAISSDGRYVAFDAKTLIGPNPLGNYSTRGMIYVRDTVALTTTTVSIASDGSSANNKSYQPAISGNGKFVAFVSSASNLVLGDTNTIDDVFLRDVANGSTKRVSADANGVQALGGLDSSSPSVSNDGRYVAFTSDATNLVPGDTSLAYDVFRKDMSSGSIERVSVSSAGMEGNDNSGDWTSDEGASISSDGNIVAFASDASNLVSNDTNYDPDMYGYSQPDVFLRNIAARQTRRVSVSATGAEAQGTSASASISADGRYVAFASNAENLVVGDTNGAPDAFRYDGGETNPPAVTSLGASNPSFSPNVPSPDGTKDTTTISASLADATPPIVWRVDIKNSAGSTVRSFSGSLGASGPVSVVWNGKDGSNIAVADGIYTAALTATDDWGNQSSSSSSIVVDTIAPVLSGWSPVKDANTLWKRPPISVGVTDERSGVDSALSAREMKIGSTVVSGTTWSGGRISGTPSFDLAFDQEHVAVVTAHDVAGNVATASLPFWVMGATLSQIPASIPDVSVPVPNDCLTGCSVTFPSIRVKIATHSIGLTSTAHRGRVTFRRPISLTAAQLTYEKAVTGETQQSAQLTSFDAQDAVSLDGYYPTLFDAFFADYFVEIGPISRQLPAGVKPGSTARISMSEQSIAPLCADTRTASNPATCGGPASAGVDPVAFEAIETPSPAELTETEKDRIEDLENDPDTPTTLSFPLPEEDVESELPPSSIPGNMPSTATAGKIGILIAEGADTLSVVIDHGGSGADFEYSVPPPFNEFEIQEGLDRCYTITVAPGSEISKLNEYAADSRVLRVWLLDNAGGERTQPPNDPLRANYQWHLASGPKGSTNAVNAWPWADFGWYNLSTASPLNGALGTGLDSDIVMAYLDSGIQGNHFDLTGKVTAGVDVLTGAVLTANTNSDVCPSRHGTLVAGINTKTDNGILLSGTDWNGKLMPIRNRDPSTPLCDFTLGGRVLGIRKAVELGARIINMSYGYAQYPPECVEAKAAWDAGVMLFGALPNPGEAPSTNFPAACPNVVGVTGHDSAGRRLAPTSEGTDVSAPAKDIRTLIYGDNGVTQTKDGTSFGTPMVAAMGQTLLAMGVPTNVAFWTIRDSATAVPSECPSPCTGLINAERAYKSSLFNGVFEVGSEKWIGYNHDPACTFGNASTFNVTRGGSESYTVACRGAGYYDLFQTRPVTPGWVYRVYVAAAHTGNNPDAVRVQVTWWDRKPGPDAKVIGRTVKHFGSEAGVNGNKMVGFSFGVCVPAQASWARIIFQTAGTSAGDAYWDDAAFRAYRQLPSGVSC